MSAPSGRPLRSGSVAPANGRRHSDRTVQLEELAQMYQQDFLAALDPVKSRWLDQPISELRAALEVAFRVRRASFCCLHWNFARQGLGTVSEDFSGNENFARSHGSVRHEPFALGGTALSLLERGSFLFAPPSPSLDVGVYDSDFTVCLYMKLQTPADGQWRSLFHKGRSDQDRTFSSWLRFDSNRLHVRISTDAYQNEGIEASNQELTAGKWTHVAYVKSGRTLSLIIDGHLDTRVTLHGPVRINPGPLYVGRTPWYSGALVSIADFRIYPFALQEALTQGVARSLEVVSKNSLEDQLDEYIEAAAEIIGEDETAVSSIHGWSTMNFADKMSNGDHGSVSRLGIAKTQLLEVLGFSGLTNSPESASQGGEPLMLPPELLQRVDAETLPLLSAWILTRIGGKGLHNDLIRELRRAFEVDITAGSGQLTSRRQFALDTLERIRESTVAGRRPRGASLFGFARPYSIP